jgi:hypothetical protein
MNFAQWQSQCAPASFRFFSLGRHALVEALRAAGIKICDRVLLPEFICRDVLASLHAVGADAVWYPITEGLRPATSPESWPGARAVLAVNYFGFPQPFDQFHAYAGRTGAVLIEDNAHGFLSRDETGRWLGTRGDAGVFSLRKSLPLPDGAVLTVRAEHIAQALAAPILPVGHGYAPRSIWRARLRRVPMIGIAASNSLTALARLFRRLGTGHTIPPPDEAAECAIPQTPAAHSALMARLTCFDLDDEIERRRSLYREAEATAGSLGIVPLFPALPPLVSPYGFPFRTGSESALARMRNWAKRHGTELIHWPELPRAIAKTLPAYHHTVWLVNFL